MSNILEAININKRVELGKNNELHILKDVNLTIEKGEFVSVMGPSGSGKSTLLYNVSSMDRITSGSVKFKEREMALLKEEELAKIRLNNMGFIFQDINLLKNLSVIDNVMFPALVSKDPDIIFGDEPTGALDSKSATEIMSILAEINKKGTTIMLITHDVKVAAKSERILYMVDGNIVAQKKMCKYDAQNDDIKEREESIMKWLVENAF
jgi:putative ABC transport system ATP-binding protein